MSEKTIADKLAIKPNTTVWLSDGSYIERIAPLPSGATTVERIEGADTAFVFVEDAASLRETLKANEAQLLKPASLWVAYRKGNRADINRDTLWPMLTPYGLRPIGQVAIDDVWSALRFRALKPGEAPFTGGRG